jgi:hypothetical protein
LGAALVGTTYLGDSKAIVLSNLVQQRNSVVLHHIMRRVHGLLNFIHPSADNVRVALDIVHTRNKG